MLAGRALAGEICEAISSGRIADFSQVLAGAVIRIDDHAPNGIGDLRHPVLTIPRDADSVTAGIGDCDNAPTAVNVARAVVV